MLIIENPITYKISSKRFEEITNQLHQLFPTISRRDWYAGHTVNACGEEVTASGCLVNYYKSYRQDLARAGLIQFKSAKSVAPTNIIDDNDIEFSLKPLTDKDRSLYSLDCVVTCWKNSFDKRIREILTETKNRKITIRFQKYWNTFVCLKSTYGCDLLTLDCDKIIVRLLEQKSITRSVAENFSTIFTTRWNNLSELLCNAGDSSGVNEIKDFRKEHKKDIDQIPKNILAFQYLALFLTKTFSINTNNKGTYSFSRPECVDHFIKFIENDFEVDEYITNLRAVFENIEVQICPYLIFCGTPIKINKIYLVISEQKFVLDVPNPGITVPVNNVPTTFKFQTVLILGDNLGLNSICGFVASFNLTKYCRICTADSCECSKLSCENEKLLRTRENYESNVVLKKPVETGILENCVFNKLDNFHIVTNKTIDFMHDVLEGVCIYVLRNILYEFIYNKKLFTLEFFNLRLQEFAMQSDNSNKPPPIKRNQFKEKLNIKYSAAEMLYLTRYFGIIIGDKVPIVNDHWKMYIYLREIVDILMSPRITDQFISVLKEKINSLNSSYVLHFQNLKPKFHFLTHYPSIIEEFGPCIHYWTMRHESRHRDIKANAVASNTHLNLLKTIATKQALKMCQVFDSFEADNNILFGPNIKKNNIHYQQVIINNSEYKVNSFLVISLANPDIQFGKIVSIKKLELKTGEVSVQFELKVYNELFFDKHIMAYVVSKDETSNKKFVKLNDIPSMPPVSAVKKENVILSFLRQESTLSPATTVPFPDVLKRMEDSDEDDSPLINTSNDPVLTQFSTFSKNSQEYLIPSQLQL
ncbi:hypothetical protein TKK_0012237 [Trichogramma kaykai]